MKLGRLNINLNVMVYTVLLLSLIVHAQNNDTRFVTPLVETRIPTKTFSEDFSHEYYSIDNTQKIADATSQDCDNDGIPDEREVQDRLVGTNRAFTLELDRVNGEATPISGLGMTGFAVLSGMAFDPHTKTIYAIHWHSGQLVMVDPETGAGVPIGVFDIRVVWDMAFNPITNKLYGTNGHELILIDPTSGAGTVVGAINYNVKSLTFDANSNTMYGVDVLRDMLIKINMVTGRGIAIGSLNLYNIETLSFDPNTNTLYGVNTHNHHLVEIDTETGKVIDIGFVGSGTIRALVFDSIDNILYGVFPGQLVVIDPNTGKVKFKATLGYPHNIMGLAYDKNTNTLYGVTNLTNQLIKFDTATGTATNIGSHGYDHILALTLDPNTNTLYASDNTNGNSQLIQINPSTGASNTIGLIGFRNVSGLAFNPISNILYGVSNSYKQLIVIDPINGVGMAIGEPLPVGIWALAYNANTNTLFASDSRSDQLIAIDPETGITNIVGATHYDFIRGLAYDSNTDTLYGYDIRTNQMVIINTETGAGTGIGSLGHMQVEGLAFDSKTNTLYGTEYFFKRLLIIDLETGSGTPIGVLGFDRIKGLAFDSISRTLYGIDTYINQLINIDPKTGAGIAVGSLGFIEVLGLAFNPENNTLYGTSTQLPGQTQLIVINKHTGKGASHGVPFNGTVQGLAFDPVTKMLYGTDSISHQLMVINPETGDSTFLGTTVFRGIFGLANITADCDSNGFPDYQELDFDADGIIDACDSCPETYSETQDDDDNDCIGNVCDQCDDSKLDATIIISMCNTGVENIVFDDGCTMVDLISLCETDVHKENDFMKCVNQTTRRWKREDYITGREFSAIINCTARNINNRQENLPIERLIKVTPP